QMQENGTGVVGQTSNRMSRSWQLVAQIGHHRIATRIEPLLRSASTSGPARNRLSCKQEWMSGRSVRIGRDPEQDAKSRAPSHSHLAHQACPQHHLTDQHSFQTLSTCVAPPKVERKAFARNAALVPWQRRGQSIPAGPESEKTGFRFLSVPYGPSQR